MDELPIGNLCLVALATLALAWALKAALRGKKTGAKHPPGPWNLPFIGSLHHLVGAQPHLALLRLSRRHGPLMQLKLGEVSTLVVSTPEAAMEVLKAQDPLFATQPRSVTIDIVSSGGKGIILAPYGEHWRQVRKICVVELLSARQVKRLDSIRQQEVTRLVESIASTSTSAIINMSQAMESLANDIIARAVFGGRCRQQEEYLRVLKEVTTMVAGFNLADFFPSSRLVRCLTSTERSLKRSHGQMVRIVDSIVEERREEKARVSPGAAAKDDDDLLDVLLRLQKEDTLSIPLTTEIIGALITDLFGAATDTTSYALEWAMVELIKNPRAMERAKHEVRNTLGHGRSTLTGANIGELPYLRMVIKETLRLHPASALILRANKERCHAMGYDIPPGTLVMINAFAIARDPQQWDDSCEFKPERFESKGADIRAATAHLGYIPFGAGRRQCPGALFATTTMELALANLLYHFDWALPNGQSLESLDLTEVFGVTMHRRSNLYLHATLQL